MNGSGIKMPNLVYHFSYLKHDDYSTNLKESHVLKRYATQNKQYLTCITIFMHNEHSVIHSHVSIL